MESFIPPVEVQANARRALEVRASKPESQRGMLAVGLGRARDLSSGRPVSLDIIRRMNSFFARHAVDKKGETWDEMGPGWQAWMGWGGDAGQRWARRILSRYEQRVSSAKENGKEVNYDAYGVHVVSSSRKGGKIGKAGPNDPPPQGAPPQGQQPQGAPPQGAPPQGAPPQGTPPPKPPETPPVPKLVEISPGKFRDENSGKIFERQATVPDDQKTKQNELDTVKYLDSAGLKEAHKALMSLSINATEMVNQDTKQRLYQAGLVEVTPTGVSVTPFGQFFINIVQSNKDIAEKEKMMKLTLYGAELYRKKKNGFYQQKQKNIPNTKTHYLQRNDGVSYLERAEGMNDTIRKSLSSFNDDEEGNGMALGQIRATRDKLEHLAQMMSGEKVGLEAWQKSKITSASDDISAVHDAVVYSYDDDSETKKMLIQKNQKENVILTEQIENPNFIKFASFEKAAPEQRVVVGYASSERVDGQNDVVDSEALSQALGDYMQWANLREMHQPKAVGKVLSATPVRGTIQLKDGSKLTNPLRIVAQIIDSETWEKVKTGVLKGFSIGGKVLQALTQKMNGKEVRRITGLQLHEISLVDRPANPDARIILMKRDDSSSSDEAVTKVVKPATISKASQNDPSKLLPQMQQLRNQAEIEGDLEQAERYNEIISLMLEAMGVIPQGTTRETGEIESGEKSNANPLNNGQQPQMGDLGNEMGIPSGMPENMMNMDQVYAYNPAFQNTANVAYAQQAGDLQKAGRMLSKSTEEQLDQIMQAVQFIVQQVQALKQSNAPAPQDPSMAQNPNMMQDANAVPQQPSGMPDLSAVPTSESPLPAESTKPNVQSTIVPQQPTSSMAPSPETMAMLRGIGNPVLAANQKIGDLKKGDVDLESIEREIRAMEQMTENSAPPMESMEGTPAEVEKSETAAPVSFDVDSIAKSLSNVIAQQLVGINQQMEQMQTVAKEQNASLFATVNPLTEAINETKASIAPLVEKMSALEPLKDKIDALANRMEALENSPADGVSPVLRGTAVAKTLGGSAAEQTLSKGANELDTIYKMLDEAKDPIVRTKLREQAAYLESKNLYRRN